MTEAQRAFVEDLAGLLAIWNMPGHTARLYGYLQIRSEPVTVDEIARDLQISRSYAFTAAKLLELYGNARRIAERGSKRIRFVAGDDPGLPLRPQAEALGQMAALITARGPGIADGPAAERLERLARFHAAMKTAMEQVILPG